jgi:hypothetical protein
LIQNRRRDGLATGLFLGGPDGLERDPNPVGFGAGRTPSSGQTSTTRSEFDRTETERDGAAELALGR